MVTVLDKCCILHMNLQAVSCPTPRVKLTPLCDLSPALSSPPLLALLADHGSLLIWVNPSPPFCQVAAVVTSVEGTDSQDVTSTWPFLPPASLMLLWLLIHFPKSQIPWDQVMHLAPVYMQPQGQGDFWLTKAQLFPCSSSMGTH